MIQTIINIPQFTRLMTQTTINIHQFTRLWHQRKTWTPDIMAHGSRGGDWSFLCHFSQQHL